MRYVGIDIGKRFHVASCLNEENDFTKQLKFNALKDGFEKLLGYISEEETNKGEIRIGFEATGHYWLTLFEKLTEQGYTVYVLNPLQVASFRNQAIRGSKTDELDCQLIAKVIKFGVGKMAEIPSDELFTLKELTRFRADLSKRITRVKLQVMAVLDKMFPEYDTIFYDLFGVASKSILEEMTTPEVIAGIDLRKVTTLLEKNSRGQLGRKKAVELKRKAKETFGLRFGINAFSLEVKLLIAQIEHLQSQLKQVDEEIKELVVKQKTNLLTIPGVSYQIAGSILGETVDYHSKEYADPRSLLAFAGLDPKLKQSGTYKGQAKMTKRGSGYLRQSLYLAAFSAMQVDARFKKIYDDQKSLGKPHLVAMSHVAKKLTYIVAAILRTNQQYREN